MAEQAEGLFIMLTVEQIQAILNAAVNLLAQGRVTMSGNVAGHSFSDQFPMQITKTIRECNWALRTKGVGPPIIKKTMSSFNPYIPGSYFC